MAGATVQLTTRIAGVQSFGYPAVLAGGIAPPTFAGQTYIQNPAGQAEVVWQGDKFGLTAPTSGGLTPNVWYLTVSVTHFVDDPANFSSVTAQLYDGATPVGSAVPFTLSSTEVTETVTWRGGYTAADMSSLAVQLVHQQVSPGLAAVSQAYAQIAYSYSNAIGLFTTDGTSAMPAVAPTVVPPVAALASAGTAAFSLTPSFGRTTAAGNLLIGWVFSNDGASSFPTTCSDPSWTLIGHSGGAFGWNSLWYKPNCNHAETAPHFSDGSTTPLSQLLEFSGARYLDQFAGGSGAEQTVTYTASARDSQSGDLVFGFAAWNGVNPGPTTITFTGDDSSGTPLNLSVASNQSSSGTQFWATGWAQASTGVGPDADTMTANIGVSAGAGGMMASFEAFYSQPAGNTLPAGRVAGRRVVTVPIAIGGGPG